MRKIAIFNDTRPDRGHYGCAIVMRNLFQHLEAVGIHPGFSLPFNRDWREKTGQMPAQGTVDAFLVNAEGSMHSSAQRHRARALVELARFAKDTYGIPAFIVNATFYNNDESFYKDLVTFDAVFVRDSASQREAEKFGVNTALVPDLSLTLPALRSAPARTGVGVTDSVVPADDDALREFSRIGRYDFRPMVTPKVIDLSGKRALKPKLLVKRALSYLGPKDARFREPDAFVEWLSSKELIVTGRYHTVALCILTRTPFVYMESNTPKITSLIEDAGLDPRRRIAKLPATLSPSETASAAFSIKEKESLERFLSLAQEEAKAMFRNISDIVA